MRSRARRALALLLPALVVVGVGYDVDGETEREVHGCERVELFVPMNTIVYGTSGCVSHDTATHLCISATVPGVVAVVVCRA